MHVNRLNLYYTTYDHFNKSKLYTPKLCTVAEYS